MFRKRMGMLAVASAAAVGALTLTACSSTTTGAAPAASSPAAASPSVAANAGVGVALQAPAQNLQVVPGTAQQNNAPANTGDLANPAGQQTTQAGEAWTELSAAQVGNLPNVVINGAGFTLYRFDKDTPNPSKSNCNDDCAAKWPPVIVDPSGKLFLDGVDMKNVGAVKRDDGSMQLTIKGWPVYRFSGDLQAGQANGQGVMGTWFAVTPEGGKAGTDSSASGGSNGSGTAQGGTGSTGTGTATNGTGSTGTTGATGSTGSTGSDAGTGSSGSAKPATNAVLFDDKNFADNGAQGVSGTGCQNVARVGVASSVQTDGMLKLWTGPDCSGTSKVINGSVQDLGTIGLDNKVASVRFS